jgi:hypothetical protein
MISKNPVDSNRCIVRNFDIKYTCNRLEDQISARNRTPVPYPGNKVNSLSLQCFEMQSLDAILEEHRTKCAEFRNYDSDIACKFMESLCRAVRAGPANLCMRHLRQAVSLKLQSQSKSKPIKVPKPLHRITTRSSPETEKAENVKAASHVSVPLYTLPTVSLYVLSLKRCSVTAEINTSST